MVTCPCGTRVPVPDRGRIPTYCSTRCRVAAHRERRRALPAELTDGKRWARRDGKRPITVTGKPASTTNPDTWATFADVQHGKGDGIGVMLGDGLACYDLDHCLTGGRLTDTARQVLAEAHPLYTEVSMSGEGLHVFVWAPEAQGWRRPGVEFYSRARFIAVTGKRFTTRSA